jgi:hypothetical protein
MRNNYGKILDELGDNIDGLKVDTSILTNTTYLAQTQQEMFNVFGRIWVTTLFGEAVTAFAAVATTLKFNFTSTTPVIAVANMTAASGSLSGKVAGTRVSCIGTAVATGALVDAGPGITAAMLPMIIGTNGGIGTIGILTAGASQTSGTTKFSISYVPLSDGAYVTAVH